MPANSSTAHCTHFSLLYFSFDVWNFFCFPIFSFSFFKDIFQKVNFSHLAALHRRRRRVRRRWRTHTQTHTDIFFTFIGFPFDSSTTGDIKKKMFVSCVSWDSPSSPSQSSLACEMYRSLYKHRLYRERLTLLGLKKRGVPDVILPPFDRVTVSIASLMKLFFSLSLYCYLLYFYEFPPTLFGPFPLYIHIPPPERIARA